MYPHNLPGYSAAWCVHYIIMVLIRNVRPGDATDNLRCIENIEVSLKGWKISLSTPIPLSRPLNIEGRRLNAGSFLGRDLGRCDKKTMRQLRTAMHELISGRTPSVAAGASRGEAVARSSTKFRAVG